jgi:putative two-component system response regulator
MTTKTEKKRLLVLDDTPSDTPLLKRYLEKSSHSVVREENDPEFALSAALKFQPHPILLDVLMPGMSGEVLAAHFQASPKLKTVPIVFLTCVVTKEQVDLCGGKIGRYPFLARPIVLTEVDACLEKHLGA